eukprot:277112_1
MFTMSQKSNQNEQCNGSFDQCISANRIKTLLNEQNNIIDNKQSMYDSQLQIKFNKLINSVQYSDVELLNDFYHIKYEHHVDDNNDEFNLFYKYLLDVDDVFQCDFNCCPSVMRYYNRRNHSRFISPRNNDNLQYTNSVNLLCRIHTYFIHSYDTTQLTTDEIKYIEKQLNDCQEYDEDTLNDKKLELISEIANTKKQNVTAIIGSPDGHNSKYVTNNHQSLDYKQMSENLQLNNVSISADDLALCFDGHGYYKHQLITDLCDILFQGNDENILLSQILIIELQCDNACQREAIYDSLLYNYINKEDLDNNNFIKVLQVTALQLITSVDCDEVIKIAANANLTGNILVKDTTEFKNSKQFATLFDSIDNFNKKEWAKIYVTINRWQSNKSKYKAPVKPQISSSAVDELPSKNDMCFLSDEETENEDTKNEETKYNENEDVKVDYIHQLFFEFIHQFCAITNATKSVAVSFLTENQWNVMFAVNKYYAANKPSKAIINFQQNGDASDGNDKVYTHGISFWYWQREKANKIFIQPLFCDLKVEILNFKNFTPAQWQLLMDECNILMQTETIKQISSNGNNLNVYGIKHDAPISEKHLYSIKLYTDYSWLCKIFCESFRLKKISRHHYER